MIRVGDWVMVDSAKKSGLVVGISSSGFARTLTIRSDAIGPDIHVAEALCRPSMPPRFRPRLATVDGVRL